MDTFSQYRLWIVAIFGGMSVFILAAIWHFYYFKRRKSHERADFGLLFLCAGLTVWVISAIMGLSAEKPEDSVRHALSMINNGLIACSFPFFEYSVISDSNKRARKYWTTITLSLTVFVLILIFAFEKARNVLDFLSSSLVLIVLTGILFKTFGKRKLAPLGYFSILIMVAMLMSQFFVTFKESDFLKGGDGFLINLGFVMSGISFTMFILLLVALAFTWILDKNDVYDEWKEEDELIKILREEPAKGIKYLESIIATGLSKYDLVAFQLFFNALPINTQEKEAIKNIYRDYLNFSGQLNRATNDFLQNMIDFDSYDRIRSRVSAGLLDMVERLGAILLPNNGNQNI